jgi:uroporphyrinogen decarboxylase
LHFVAGLGKSHLVTSRERFQKAIHCEPLERPPVWLMRQAGRYLPEYRALKAKYSFLEMAHTPELAAEVTLQPLRRYALDAAIIFSDILVIPEAMGLPYSFREQGGIEMAFGVRSRADLSRLAVSGAAEKLDYVTKAIRLVRDEVKNEKAVLGFCGSPWTLAAYMVDGGVSGGLPALTAMYRDEAKLFHDLLQGITTVCCDYVRALVKSGVDAIQIFDSWAALCPEEIYQEASLQWIGQIVAAANGEVPIILFAKGKGKNWQELVATGASVISVDWTVDLAALRDALPANVAVQGNLDPRSLLASEKEVRQATGSLLAAMRGKRGFIFNLGHGLTPDITPENVGALVETVTGWGNT